MNYAAMKTEVPARGFDSLSAARVGQIVNDAVAELDEARLWPYREKTASGTSPLSIADLGPIESVVNTTDDTTLSPVSRLTLTGWSPDLTTTGDPLYYYVDWTSGTPRVTTYPVSTDTIQVRYWKATAALSLDADTPAAPSRFHSTYLLIAQRMAESERGNSDRVAALQGEIDRQIDRMGEALLVSTVQGPSDYQSVTFASEDW